MDLSQHSELNCFTKKSKTRANARLRADLMYLGGVRGAKKWDPCF